MPGMENSPLLPQRSMSRLAACPHAEAPLCDRLRMAIATQSAHQVAQLLAEGADPNGLDSYGDLPLATPPNPEVASLLLAAGADPGARSSGGETMLGIAWRHGLCGLALLLLEAGADPSIAGAELSASGWRMRSEEGLSVFLLACASGRMKAVEAGLVAGCSLEECSTRGSTPLMCAVREGRLEVAELLLKAGAKVDATRPDGWTALMISASYGQAKCVRRLIEAGAALGGENITGSSLAQLCERYEATGMMAVVEQSALIRELGPSADRAPRRGGGLRM